MYTVGDIVEAVGKMSVNEMMEMVKDMEERFGVTAASALQPQTAWGATAPTVATEEKKEEKKDSWKVDLLLPGQKRIAVIKEVRVITSLSLKDAKDLVDNAPFTIKKDLSKAEAQEIAARFEAVGAIVDLV